MRTYGDLAIDISHRFGYQGLMTEKIFRFAVGLIELGGIDDNDEEAIEKKGEELVALSREIRRERETIYKSYFMEGKIWVQ